MTVSFKLQQLYPGYAMERRANGTNYIYHYVPPQKKSAVSFSLSVFEVHNA
jgi:hypothetical protein